MEISERATRCCLVAFIAALCTGCEALAWLSLRWQEGEISAHLYSTTRLDPVGKLVVSADGPPEHILRLRLRGPEFVVPATYAMQFFPWQGCGRTEVARAMSEFLERGSSKIPRELSQPVSLSVRPAGVIEQEFRFPFRDTLFKTRDPSIGVAIYRRTGSSDGQAMASDDVLVSCGLLGFNVVY